MKTYLIISLVVLGLGAGVCRAEELPFSGVINADRINLRLDATTTAPVISTLDKGERIEVVQESYDWYKVRLPKGTAVYIKKNLAGCIKYTDTRQLSPGPQAEQCLSARVLKDRVNIRSKPGESAPIVGIADENEIVNVISEAGGWYRIEPIQNTFGWVHKKFVDKAPLPAATTAVTATPADNTVIFIGTIEPYGMVFMRRATHKLITTDNQVFLLRGNRSTLNALNRQKVRVTGKVISPVTGRYPTIEVKMIEVAS